MSRSTALHKHSYGSLLLWHSRFQEEQPGSHRDRQTSDLHTASGDLQDHPDHLRFLVQGALSCLEHHLPLQLQT